MVSSATLTVIPYERRYRSQVLDLISYSYLRHTHFDWYSTEEWLDNMGSLTRLAWRSGHLAGVMAANLPFHAMSWLRVACVSEGLNEIEVITALWQSIRAGLRDKGAVACWLVALEPWIESHTAHMGMSRSELLISMRRGSSTPLQDAPITDVTLASGEIHDVSAMATIDQAAFVPPFQMNYADIRRAYRGSTTSTVAKIDNQIVGYQISSRHGSVGHLGRLAVMPGYQGRHIGAALVREVVAAFLRRQVEVITVNTQLSNTRSQMLYQTYGFERNGYDTPMFSVSLI
jgi:ribosomal-protein-alanine N-acetyltransferase